MTNPEYEPGRDKNEQYREHVTASLDASPWARIIKASDFTDNGAGLIHTSGPRVAYLASKYAGLVPVLREMISRPDTPLGKPAQHRILAQLDRAEERFDAILPPTGAGLTDIGLSMMRGVMSILVHRTRLRRPPCQLAKLCRRPARSLPSDAQTAKVVPRIFRIMFVRVADGRWFTGEGTPAVGGDGDRTRSRARFPG